MSGPELNGKNVTKGIGCLGLMVWVVVILIGLVMLGQIGGALR